jgi:hypothetical protein
LRHFLETGPGAILNRRIEMTGCHRDGHEFPVEITISPARLGDAYIFSAFIRDITARKRTAAQDVQKTRSGHRRTAPHYHRRSVPVQGARLIQ